MLKILVLILLMNNYGFAQNNSGGSEDFFNALRDQMKGDRKELEKYFKGDLIDKMDKLMEEMHSDFFKQWDQVMQDDQLGDFFKQMEIGEEDIPLEWMKTPTGMKLIVKIQPIKDAPFEIEIKNHQLILKGTVEKIQEIGSGNSKVSTRRIYTFNRAILIPEDLDPQSAVISQKDASVEILFSNQRKKSKTTKKKDPTKPANSLQPLVPKEGDINL